MNIQEGHRLSREQRTVLRRMGYKPIKFLFITKDFESYTFLEIATHKVLMLYR